jgi:hypothetical protein
MEGQGGHVTAIRLPRSSAQTVAPLGQIGGQDRHGDGAADRGAEAARADLAQRAALGRVKDLDAFADRRAALGAQADAVRAGAIRPVRPECARRRESRPRGAALRRTLGIDQPSAASPGVVVVSMSWP